MGGWVGGWMDGWVDGSKSRVKDCLQQSIKCQINKTSLICTKLERIYTINSQLLIFRAKSLLDGWKGGRMEGWMDGWESRVKDCLQQSKKN